jgi:nitric oxide synthase-interacting protein
VFALRPSGAVLSEEGLKATVVKTRKCPVTGKDVRKKDIVELQKGGTGFAAHNDVEFKLYKTAMG